MAFEDIQESNRTGRLKLNNVVKVCVTKAGQVSFTLSPDIFSRLGEPSYFQIMIGTEEDHGSIFAIPCDRKSGTSVPVVRQAPKSKSVKFAIGHHRIGVQNTRRKTFPVAHQVVDEGVIISIRPLMKPVAVADAA